MRRCVATPACISRFPHCCFSYLFTHSASLFSFIYLFTYFWLPGVLVAVSGCSPVTVSRGCSLLLVHGLLALVASLSCCRARTLVWGRSSFGSGLRCPATRGILVSQRGIKPVSPALAGRCLASGPPGEFCFFIFLAVSFFFFTEYFAGLYFHQVHFGEWFEFMVYKMCNFYFLF